MAAREDGSRLAQLWSALSVPDNGEVMIDLGWKTSAAGVAFLRRFVSAPKITFDLKGDDDCWIEFAEDALAKFQKKLIQGYVTSELEKQSRRDTKYAVPVPAEFFDKDALLEQWEQQEAAEGKTKGKLSAAAIGEFFDASMKDILTLSIVEAWEWSAEEFEEPENKKKLEKTVESYKALFTDLDKAAPHKVVQAKKCLEKTNVEGTMIGKRLGKKITKLLAPKPGTDPTDLADVF
ncbi:unnamed protein product [Sphagnum jensenii]